MSDQRLLIAGIGNIFLGDDAFGVEVVRRLLPRRWPAAVAVADFGIRGLDLAYALLDGWEAAILIDALPHGEVPGTLFVIEPQLDSSAPQSLPLIEAHSMDPVKVLGMVAAMGRLPDRIFIVGCQPSPLPEDENQMQMQMSPPVAAAVDEAAGMVQSLARRILRGEVEPAVPSTVPPPPAAAI